MDMYSCPVCKAQNHEHQKYCYKCGTWLQSTAFPAKKLSSTITPTKTKKTGYVVPIIIFALILISLYRWDNAAKFDRFEIGDQYVLSQLVVKRPLLRSPSAMADLTTLQDSRNPHEVVAVFYAKDGNRLGTASAILTQGVSKNQTSTINFAFDGSPMLSNLGQVRIEIKQLSPLDMIDRVADKINKMPLK